MAADGKLIFSKLASGRFPENEEIFETIEKIQGKK